MAKKTTELKDMQALNQLDNEWLKKELDKAKKELFVLKMKKVANELKQTHLLKLYRKYIARLSTLIWK